jgi:DNA-binding response OmpR family regulator
MTPRILLIDDDSRLASMVAEYLGHSGFEVETAGSLAAGRGKLAAGHYDALVLDLMLPDGDGLDLCRELRGESRTRHLPLLMLTARGEPMDRIVGLELGADDYLPKPFEPRELLARVKALLRRAAPQPADDDVLRFGRLEIDLGARVARLDGKVCDLTGHQFDLLVVLAQSPGRVLTRDQIMDSLKGHPLEAFDRSIDVHISRIRALIEDDPKAPRRVLTVRGAGYVFARKQDAEDTPNDRRSPAGRRAAPKPGRAPSGAARPASGKRGGTVNTSTSASTPRWWRCCCCSPSPRASWSSSTSTANGSATSRRPTSGSRPGAT